MKRTLPTFIAASGVGLAIAAGSLAVSIPVASAATAPTAAVSASHPRAALSAWIRAHRRAITRSAIDKSALVIGITPAALVAALRSGQSIAQVAQAHGVQPTAVSNELIAAGIAKIASLEADHRVNVVRAARLRLRLDRATAKLLTHHFR